MLNENQIAGIALRTLQIEADSIAALKHAVDADFINAVLAIYNTRGRVILSGIGKSAIIARKITATFNSTGTPSDFMHAADAIHGDLGIVQRDDVVIVISNSGNTPEIKVLAQLIKNGGNTLIAMTGNPESELAKHADFILNSSVKQEACPHNLAPTSSTTAQVALGDALAVCLLEIREFTPADFARYHPGGSLGKKLYLKVDDLWPSNPVPSVSPETPVTQVILEISSKRLGAAAVTKDGVLKGIITDGDLRRMMQQHQQFDKLTAGDIMSLNPKTAQRDMMAVEALQIMKENNIMQLIILDGENLLGFVHLHDLLKEGIF